MNEWGHSGMCVSVCVFHFHLPLCVPKEGDEKRKEGEREGEKKYGSSSSSEWDLLAEVFLCERVCVHVCECPYLLNEPSRSISASTDTCDPSDRPADTADESASEKKANEPNDCRRTWNKAKKWWDRLNCFRWVDFLVWNQREQTFSSDVTLRYYTGGSMEMNSGWIWFNCYSFRAYWNTEESLILFDVSAFSYIRNQKFFKCQTKRKPASNRFT